jgi:hypothetical protein
VLKNINLGIIPLADQKQARSGQDIADQMVDGCFASAN